MSLILSPQAVLTRLCGCDKLLQSLSVELAQLQMDKVGNSKDLILYRQYTTQAFNLKTHTYKLSTNSKETFVWSSICLL